MTDDQIFQAIGWLGLVAHLGVAAWWWSRRGPAPYLLNLVFAVLTLVFLAQWLPRAFQRPFDEVILASAALELLVVIAALLALRGQAWARWLSGLAFVAHLAICAGAVAIALTFKINRLL